MGVLVRHLPVNSALAIALNDGQPPWTRIHDLLADLWVVLVRANSEKDSLPEDFDHPFRAEMTARAKTEHKRALKQEFERRKAAYRRSA